MMQESKLYDVYNIITKQRVLRNATCKQVKIFVGDGGIIVSTYAKKNSIFDNRFMITIAGEKPVFKDKAPRRNGVDAKEIRYILLREWDKTCEPFKLIEWVKDYEDGVRILR